MIRQMKGSVLLAEKATKMKYEEDERDRKKVEQKQKEEAAKMALKKALWVGFVAMFRPEYKSLSHK
jgi:hypothetical protein